MILMVIALGSPAAAQNVLTVDSSGNLTANATLNAKAGVGGGTYGGSGITATGTGTCYLAFISSVGTGATASVGVSSTTIGPTLTIIATGYGYTSPPTQAMVTGSSPSGICSGSSVSVNTYLSGVLNVQATSQPAQNVSGNGSIWFDNATDWPLPVPMGIDSSGTYKSAMVLIGGTPVTGPFYWGVGMTGGYMPNATWTVYNNSANGSTNELIQAGAGQTGNIWVVENNIPSPLWAVSQAGTLNGTGVGPTSTTGAAAPDILDFTGATGGTCNATACAGGAGGSANWTLGAGGTANPSSGAGTGGTGGSLAVTAGIGGAGGTVNSAGGSGGAVTVASGVGGAPNGTGNAGAGGSLTVAAGAGGAGVNGGSGAGGAVTVASGLGGVPTGTGTVGNSGLVTVRGADQTASTGAISGQVLVRGGNNAATNTSSQGGGVELLAGASTGSTQGLQGVIAITAVYKTGTTVTQWRLECSSNTAAMVVHDCAVASSVNFAGVAEVVNPNTVQVVISGQVPISASAAVTQGDTVCSGGAGHPNQVVDSGGTAACPNPGTTVGIAMATSGTWTLPDGQSFTASTTLPLVQLMHF